MRNRETGNTATGKARTKSQKGYGTVASETIRKGEGGWGQKLNDLTKRCFLT